MDQFTTLTTEHETQFLCDGKPLFSIREEECPEHADLGSLIADCLNREMDVTYVPTSQKDVDAMWLPDDAREFPP